jgi:EF-P beta-lysylation protein EpmB
MIPRLQAPGHESHWQSELRSAFRDARALLEFVGVPAQACGLSAEAAARFACLVPRPFARRIRHGDAHDPLLKQVLPSRAELIEDPRFSTDPVGESRCEPVPGLLHKYAGRALLTATGACAVHCRYCFRRHFPYSAAGPSSRDWSAVIDYLRADESLHEVVLSGGDPLVLTDRRIAQLLGELEHIPHLRRVRIHTRLPVVLPCRVEPELLALLAACTRPIVIVLHANHPNELDFEVAHACTQLRAIGASLLNQSVLLAGVNDDASTLADLSERLMDIGVVPYYLHLLDRVAGAVHFEVDDSRARELQTALSRRLPGYLVPRFVRECAGDAAKLPLVWSRHSGFGAGEYPYIPTSGTG